MSTEALNAHTEEKETNQSKRKGLAIHACCQRAGVAVAIKSKAER